MAEEITLPNEVPVKNRAPKLASERALPTVGAEALVRIIKGYAVASNGGEDRVNYKDVASATGLSPTVVSGNNTFLTESGIIVSPKYGYYVPSEEAVRFAREAAWNEENAKSHLRRLVLATWYGQVTVQNFATRLSLSRDELRRVLGIKCGASEADGKALNYIIDFLIYLGIVSQGEDDLLRRGNIDELGKQVLTSTTLPERVYPPEHLETISPPGEQKLPAEARETTIVLNLNLNINVNDLTTENAERLREWIASVTRRGDELPPK